MIPYICFGGATALLFLAFFLLEIKLDKRVA